MYFLDGEILYLAMPQSVSYSRKPKLKGNFSPGVWWCQGLCCVSHLESKDNNSSWLSRLPYQNSRTAACNDNHLISLSMLRTTKFHAVDLTMVYFLNMKATSAVPYPQCQNKNSTFLILSEYFAAKSLFPATQKESFPKCLYNHSPLAPSQTHFMTLGFHILLLCGSHQSRTSVYTHVL